MTTKRRAVDAVPSWDRGEFERAQQARRDGGAMLLHTLLNLYASCKLTAKDLCTLCHHCTAADVLGADFELYAVPPDRCSGRYQAHLDTVLPQGGPYYYCPVPCKSKRKAARGSRIVPMNCAWVRLLAELKATDVEQMLDDSTEREENASDTPTYIDHPLVQTARRQGLPKPIPLALYVDAVRYTAPLAGRSDSILGFWMVNLLTNKRHVLAVLRTSDFCACGCRAWCTLYPVLAAISWMFAAFATGVSPSHRHDGAPWAVGDALGVVTPLRTAVLLWIKGDWAEHNHTLGLSPWSTWANPCAFCRGIRDAIHMHYRSCSLTSLPWQDREDGDYDRNCARCEIRVVVRDAEARNSIIRDGRLAYMKGKQGKGRTLTSALPAFGLLVGDRLEPSVTLQDVSKLESLDMDTPIELTFWRVSLAGDGTSMDAVCHRCPLFSDVLGTSPDRSLCVDTLHTVYYGPVMRWVSAALWRMALANPWGLRGTADVQKELAIRRLNANLQSWQVREKVPANRRIGELTLKMVGNSLGANNEHLHPGTNVNLKAAEMGLMLKFCVDEVQRSGRRLKFYDELLAAGQSLVTWLAIIHEAPLVMQPAQLQALMDSAVRHLVHCERCRISFAPKHHLFIHLTARTADICRYIHIYICIYKNIYIYIYIFDILLSVSRLKSCMVVGMLLHGIRKNKYKQQTSSTLNMHP